MNSCQLLVSDIMHDKYDFLKKFIKSTVYHDFILISFPAQYVNLYVNTCFPGLPAVMPEFMKGPKSRMKRKPKKESDSDEEWTPYKSSRGNLRHSEQSKNQV